MRSEPFDDFRFMLTPFIFPRMSRTLASALPVNQWIFRKKKKTVVRDPISQLMITYGLDNHSAIVLTPKNCHTYPQLDGPVGGSHTTNESATRGTSWYICKSPAKTIWLVVDLPLWKIMEWVRHLGWWHSIPNGFWKVIKFHGSKPPIRHGFCEAVEHAGRVSSGLFWGMWSKKNNAELWGIHGNI